MCFLEWFGSVLSFCRGHGSHRAIIGVTRCQMSECRTCIAAYRFYFRRHGTLRAACAENSRCVLPTGFVLLGLVASCCLGLVGFDCSLVGWAT